MRLLHVPQVARVLHDDGRRRRGPDAAARLAPTTHSEKSRTRALNASASGGAEQAAVVLHRRAAPGAVDDDRRVARHRRDHAPGEAARLVVAAGVHVQRAAAVAARGPGRATRAPAARITRDASTGACRAATRPSRSR